jgi:hypothetical protein
LSEKKTNKWQAATLILIFLFATSILIAFLQFPTIESYQQQLLDTEEKMELIQDELITSQNQISSLSAQLDFYKQLTISNQDIAEKYRLKLIQRTDADEILPDEDIAVQILAPSVRLEGPIPRFVGVALTLFLQIKTGTGEILVNTEPKMGLDIQSSARLAASVAENLTGYTLLDRDIIISIRSNSAIEAVDGPSAGATMTVLLVSALEGKEVRSDVMMTGTIEPGGEIGSVGEIAAKAEAAASAGASIFLIPKGQAQQIIYQNITRKIFSAFEITTLEPLSVDIRDYAAEKWGLRVVEVKHIAEVLRFFFVED